MRVLAAQDEPEMAGLMRRALIEEGYVGDPAVTGDAGTARRQPWART